MGGEPVIPSITVDNYQQADDGNIVVGNDTASEQVAITANEIATDAGVEAVLDSPEIIR